MRVERRREFVPRHHNLWYSESLFLADLVVAIATKLGSIKAIIDVDLPHPRERTDPSFIALERQVKQLVREEVDKPGVM